jgi:hypothetical protein
VIEIKQAATLAGSISNQLLTLSRRGGSSAETLDINAVIGEMGPLIARSLGTGRRLALELGTPAGMVRGDRNRLKQVFLNLALNARDAMPQGGEMRIESAPVDIDAGNPRWRECRPGRYVRIRVTDSGQGMDGATLARIFEPFFTTKKSGAGTGLGLAVVHAIIEQSGGYISASSEIGKGTCFEILLATAEEPRADVDTPAAAKAGETAAAVLLVDEDGAVRRLMRAREKPESYQRLELCNAASAMRFSRIRPGPVGMAPSGVAMPGMGGLELADRQEGNAGFVFGCGSVETARGGPLPMPVSSQPCPAAELAWRARTSVEQAPAVAR